MTGHPMRFAPYEPRTITFLGLHECAQATLKLYGISRDGTRPDPALLEAACRLAGVWLAAPRAACTAGGVDWAACPEHGLGSLIVHTGRESVFAVLDCWLGENMLRHHAWAAPLAGSGRFESLAPSGVAICVWELAVVQHERAAWLRHVLTPEGRADRAAYLADVLNATL